MIQSNEILWELCVSQAKLNDSDATVKAPLVQMMQNTTSKKTRMVTKKYCNVRENPRGNAVNYTD